jgi:hypothetical protein
MGNNCLLTWRDVLARIGVLRLYCIENVSYLRYPKVRSTVAYRHAMDAMSNSTRLTWHTTAIVMRRESPFFKVKVPMISFVTGCFSRYSEG